MTKETKEQSPCCGNCARRKANGSCKHTRETDYFDWCGDWRISDSTCDAIGIQRKEIK